MSPRRSTQSYYAEHQLTQVALLNNQTLLATWNFFYDGDGNPSTGSGQAG